MGFYVRPEYFEVIHYYYFSLGIFSFMCSMIFGFSAVYSLVFILLYIGLSAFAWYTSWFMQKRMREFIIPNLDPNILAKIRSLECVTGLSQEDPTHLMVHAVGEDAFDIIIDSIYSTPICRC
jgi:hypothetical protein